MQVWIGVDLDGTLAHYDHWRGPLHIGAPVKLMVARVQNWLDEGKRVKIFTARVCDRELASEITAAVKDWTEKHVGERLEVTNKKDYGMIELWDDRAIQVRRNTGERVG